MRGEPVGPVQVPANVLGEDAEQHFVHIWDPLSMSSG
jgi:hypothetical protein